MRMRKLRMRHKRISWNFGGDMFPEDHVSSKRGWVELTPRPRGWCSRGLRWHTAGWRGTGRQP